MTFFDLQSLFPFVLDAGKAILSIYAADFEHTLKADRSPLTEADKVSQKILLDALRQLAPEIPVLSEEAEQPPYQTRKGWDYYFLIDPLDGTREFVNKVPEFSVNVALIHRNRPVMGIIHSPNEQRTYFAEQGSGAYMINGDQNKLRLPCFQTSGEAIEVLLSRTDISQSIDQLLSRIPKAQVVRIGSSLKFCKVADGSGDFYPRLKGSMEWDTAAGTILVEEAGGHVYNLSGRPIEYNRENLVNPPFYVLGAAFLKKMPAWNELLLLK